MDAEQRLKRDYHPSLNERKILDILRRSGGITRAAVSAEMDLAQQSVHRIIEDLISRGFIRTGQAIKNGRGQPSLRLELANEAIYVLGISINTDSAVVCIADFACNVLEEVTLRTPPLSLNSTLDALSKVIDRMLQRNALSRDHLLGVGVAIAGYFVDEGRVNAPEPLQDWSLIDLRPLLEQALEMPVWLKNNATTGAIGESLIGVGAWANNFIYLSFNYGFGTGIVIDGKPYFGTHGNAGEIMLYTHDEVERRPALRYLIDALHKQDIQIDSIEDLRNRFDSNWPGVDEWVEHVRPGLDRLINTLTGLFDPQAIVFGGQVPAELGRRLIDNVSFWGSPRYGTPAPRPKLLLTESNGDAAAIGAALIPLKERFFL
ncbi:ROK family transcriptional regulator [Pseudomonas trivialis]|uniref:NagC family transcriptional regulator n=1 Tax=Pseudomonas trivialis TaxID=200450 RepID=A0A0R2ZUZ1_9PSED|nr:ROK family transcriptional regulator [Pseudomonas trivialis]KRP62427.1 NagC family transcriptional regulator [Pseudomonas trivialis]SDS33046.1 Sugar kinase of the NBD/HSP70 family, may contain an N-terminal HTH domain [Pseudomonas trivialis]